MMQLSERIMDLESEQQNLKLEAEKLLFESKRNTSLNDKKKDEQT